MIEDAGGENWQPCCGSARVVDRRFYRAGGTDVAQTRLPILWSMGHHTNNTDSQKSDRYPFFINRDISDNKNAIHRQLQYLGSAPRCSEPSLAIYPADMRELISLVMTWQPHLDLNDQVQGALHAASKYYCFMCSRILCLLETSPLMHSIEASVVGKELYFLLVAFYLNQLP